MKYLKFFGVAASVIGAIGGFGYAIYYHQPVIAICIAVLGYAAFPTVKSWVKEIIG